MNFLGARHGIEMDTDRLLVVGILVMQVVRSREPLLVSRFPRQGAIGALRLERSEGVSGIRGRVCFSSRWGHTKVLLMSI